MKNTHEMCKILCAIALSTSLIGCSKNEDAATETKTSPVSDVPTLNDALSQKGREQAVVSALPQGDPSTPLNQYKELTDDKSIMFIYYALSNLPIDYDKILQSYSRDYILANDAFKKQDILQALKPKVDQELAAAKSARYLKITLGNFYLQKYDFNEKGFSQDTLSNNSTIGFSGYQLTFTNGDQFKFLKVEDEAKARLIEEKRSKFEQLSLVMYVYAQDVNLTQNQVKSQVMKIFILDRNGKELYTQSI